MKKPIQKTGICPYCKKENLLSLVNPRDYRMISRPKDKKGKPSKEKHTVFRYACDHCLQVLGASGLS